jgi:hypothetical protein
VAQFQLSVHRFQHSFIMGKQHFAYFIMDKQHYSRLFFWGEGEGCISIDYLPSVICTRKVSDSYIFSHL